MWISWLPLVLFGNMWTQLYAAPPPPSFSNEPISDIGLDIVDEIESEPELLDYLQSIVNQHANYPLENGQDNVPQYDLLTNAEVSTSAGRSYNNYVNPSNFRDLHNYVYNMPGLQSYNRPAIEISTPKPANELDQKQDREVSKPGQENRTENAYICFEKSCQRRKQCINKNITNKLIINQATNTTQIRVNQFGQNKNVLHNLVTILNSQENIPTAEGQATDFNQHKDDDDDEDFENAVKSSDVNINFNSTIQKVRKLNNKHMENMLRKILKALQGIRELENAEILARDEIPEKLNDKEPRTTSIISDGTTLANTTTLTFTTPMPTAVTAPTSGGSTTSKTVTTLSTATSTSITSTESPTCPLILRTDSTNTPSTENATSSPTITRTTSKYPSWFKFHYITSSSTIVGPAVNISNHGLAAADRDSPLNEPKDHNSRERKLLHCTSPEKPRNRSRRPLNPHEVNSDPISYELNQYNPTRSHRRRPNKHCERNAFGQRNPKRPGTVYLRRVIKKKRPQFTSTVRFAKFKPATKLWQSTEDVDDRSATFGNDPRSCNYDDVHQAEVDTDLCQHKCESEETAEAPDYGRPNY